MPASGAGIGLSFFPCLPLGPVPGCVQLLPPQRPVTFIVFPGGPPGTWEIHALKPPRCETSLRAGTRMRVCALPSPVAAGSREQGYNGPFDRDGVYSSPALSCHNSNPLPFWRPRQSLCFESDTGVGGGGGGGHGGWDRFWNSSPWGFSPDSFGVVVCLFLILSLTES